MCSKITYDKLNLKVYEHVLDNQETVIAMTNDKLSESVHLSLNIFLRVATTAFLCVVDGILPFTPQICMQ